MSRLMSAMAVAWSGVSVNSKASSNSRCQGVSGGKRETRRGLSLGVQLEQLVGQVGERFAHARLARGPGRAAQPVELRLGAFERLVGLHQVHALERHVQARVVGVSQAHELAAPAVALERLQSLELPDAVVHVHHVIARLQLGEIADRSSRSSAAGAARAASRQRSRTDRRCRKTPGARRE